MPISIAIIGAGPRGLWAVEELSRVAYLNHLPLNITVFDAREPGVGGAYGVDQPEHVRVNVWSPVIRTAMGSLDDYRKDVLGEAQPLEEFPPRATVGRFLKASWEHAVAHLPSTCAINFVREDATELSQLDSFDHVLVVTGHEVASHPSGMLDPFTQLNQVDAGSTVRLRGAALTAIDSILSLTLGRGGRIENGTYIPSGKEPARIYPTSCSGRFIQLKIQPATDAEKKLLKPFVPRIAALSSVDELKNLLAEATEAITGEKFTWDALEPAPDALAEFRESLAHLRRLQQTVGLVWRELYTPIIERFSFDELSLTDDFAELARLLETYAYGAPAEQVERLIAVAEAGILDFSYLADGSDFTADFTVDAVLAAPGAHPETFCARVLEAVAPEQVPTDSPVTVRTEPNGMLPGQTRFAFTGRMTEPYVLGNDSLSRNLHTVIPQWAQTIASLHAPSDVYALPPLTGRLEPWIREVAGSVDLLQRAVKEHNSPVNLVQSDAMERNCTELTAQGEKHGVDVRVFFARKANKALTFVERARDAGHGVDVASHRELSQTLAAGMPGERIILSAAIKTDELLQLAIDNGVTISVDTCAEFDRITALAGDKTVRVAPRIAPDPERFMPTRFGELTDVWAGYLAEPHQHVKVAGVHLHLHGYSAQDRIDALLEATDLIQRLKAVGHHLEFIDIGGGVPMSYLDDADQWTNFKQALTAQNKGAIAPFTWKADPLKNFYPFHQAPVRGDWLDQILTSPAGDAIRELGVRLHLEPGRSILDGCGLIVARVAFIKKRSDGVPLVGLAMNRTQLRTTSDDYLVDPLHVRASEPAADAQPYEGYLVGAYCIEDEVIMRRPIRFPQGVQVGDFIVFPNTAGYFMHILESASHQIPLAKNLVYAGGKLELDAIDG
ncbi:FAD/NAD(P)-binding protein [Rothia terrae]|uniref:FAD/NAD(P)-binding protein n=1 Tax=Rothia terrae TaxID=396015 RepID=UPI0038158FB6